ncbi:MAG: AAA family ATPase [Chloroflexota bacterium]|nr:AAA family ATPase [Chloroflexota bacterium]
MNCPRCSTPAADDAKFCANCGAPLPRPREAEGERRVVTVLFCDVKGSTALAESLDPEDWAAIIGGAFDALTEPIRHYEGTLARLMGDAVLAYFGAPVAHEDDPERAILAALEMRRAAAAYSDRLRAERGIGELGIRIGINTGLAVLGEAGRSQGIEYTAMGDAVNVAARLQAAASEGGIVVGESTHRAAAEAFEFRPLDEIEVRGRSARVRAYEVLGPRSHSDRARDVPLVGRQAELAILRSALDELRMGRGRVIAIVGEAGLGKSRLLDELRREWEGDWSDARGQSYGASRPFLFLRQHLRHWSGASDGEAPDEVREKVRALAAEEAPDPDAARAAVDALFAVDAVETSDIAGQALRDEILALVERVIVRRFASLPAVVCCDDLHWSDPSSVDLLVRAFGAAESVPVLFLCTFRPDRQSPAWRLRQTVETELPHLWTEVALAPLPAVDGGELLARTLRGADLPKALRERILERAEGNPFFIEEIVRALIQEGIVERAADGTWKVERDSAEVRLPETIQSVVTARIDRLDESARRTLQSAAVIGRTFARPVLARVSGADGQLDRDLATLQRVDLIREVARLPERVFAFRHALTQEAAYGSILQRRRREMHLSVALTLEELHADGLEDYAGVIGRHYREAGDARAVSHLRSAGDRAMRLYALEDAIARYSEALDALGKVQTGAATVIALYEGRGRAYELRGDHASAYADWEKLEALGRERGDRKMELSGLARRITLHATPTARRDVEEAGRLNEQALPLARELADPELLARSLWNQMQITSWRSDEVAALAIGREAAAVARAAGLRELLAFILNDTARRAGNGASNDEIERNLIEAGEIFRQLGNKPMLADNLSTRSYLAAFRGDYDTALASSAEALRVSVETDNPWGRAFSRFGIGHVYFDRGDWGAAIAGLEEALVDAQKAGFIAVLVGPRADLAWFYREAGDSERARAHLAAADETAASRFADWRRWTLAHRALEAAEQGRHDEAEELATAAFAAPEMPHVPIGAVYARMARATVLLARNDHEGVVALARGAYEDQTRVGFASYRPDWGWYEADSLRALGRLDAASARLDVAEREAIELDAQRSLWRIYACRALIADEHGRAADARAARVRVREIVERIARSLEPVGLTGRFVARADVAEILGRP